MTKYVTKPQQVTIQEIHFTGTITVETNLGVNKTRSFPVVPGNVIVFRSGMEPISFENLVTAIKALDIQEVPSGPTIRGPFTDPAKVDMEPAYQRKPMFLPPSPHNPYLPEMPPKIWCATDVINVVDAPKTFLTETQPIAPTPHRLRKNP